MKPIIAVIVALLLLFTVVGAAHGQEVTHEFDDILIELNSQDYKETLYNLEMARQDLNEELATCKSISYPNLKLYDDFIIDENAPLTERLSAIKKYVNQYTAIVSDASLALSESSEKMLSLMQKHAVLCKHYDELVVILEKMSASQLEDLGVAQDQLGLVQQEVQDLRLRMKLIQAMEQKQFEKLKKLERAQKRVRISGAVVAGVGVGLLILGKSGVLNDEQSSFCTGAGIVGTAAGLGTIALTIHF